MCLFPVLVWSVHLDLLFINFLETVYGQSRRYIAHYCGRMLVCLCSCLGCLDCFLWSSFWKSDPLLSYLCVQTLLHQKTTTSPLSSCWLLTFWHWFMLSILILKLSLIYLLMSILNLVIINSRLSVLRLKVLLQSVIDRQLFLLSLLFFVCTF